MGMETARPAPAMVVRARALLGAGAECDAGGGIRDTGGEREEREACHVAMWGKLRSGG